MPQANILAPGYSKGHVEDCLQERFGSEKTLLQGIFVNSTISLEGVVRWLSQVGLTGSEQPPMGCFDWDPFVYLLGHDIDMVQQDVPAMLDAVFRLLTPAKPASSGLKFPATDEQQLSRCLAVRRYRVSSQRAVCSSVTRPLIQPPLRAAGSPVVYVLHRQRQSAGSGSGGYHSW